MSHRSGNWLAEGCMIATAALQEPKTSMEEPGPKAAPRVAADLAIAAGSVSPANTNKDVILFFKDHPELASLPVVEDGVPIGIINRGIFLTGFSMPFHREVYERKSCIAFMDKRPLVVDAGPARLRAGPAGGGSRGQGAAGRIHGHAPRPVLRPGHRPRSAAGPGRAGSGAQPGDPGIHRLRPDDPGRAPGHLAGTAPVGGAGRPAPALGAPGPRGRRRLLRPADRPATAARACSWR